MAEIKTPIGLVVVRLVICVAAVCVAFHLVRVGAVAVPVYVKVGWCAFIMMLGMVVLSLTRRPFAGYVLAVFMCLLPFTLYLALWRIVLVGAPLWEFILVGVGVMALPIAFGLYILKADSMRGYFAIRSPRHWGSSQ